jgi:ferrous iron transport protein A
MYYKGNHKSLAIPGNHMPPFRHHNNSEEDDKRSRRRFRHHLRRAMREFRNAARTGDFDPRRVRRHLRRAAHSQFHEIPHRFKDAVPLAEADCNQPLRLVGIYGGPTVKKRLLDLGLNPGSEIRVVNRGHHGPVIVAVKVDSRLAIGRRMADNIFVMPMPQGAPAAGDR